YFHYTAACTSHIYILSLHDALPIWRVPDELNEAVVYRIARAWAAFIGAGRVCMGRDIRPTSDAFADAFAEGLADSGVDVVDLGIDRKSTRLNSSHVSISYAVFCLKK